jgi:hypothetical protein
MLFCLSTVILSPYGLKGTLSGQSFKESDASVQKMLSDWRKFYPLSETLKEKNASSKSTANWNTGGTFPIDSVDNFCSWIGQQVSSFGSFSTNSSAHLPPVVEVIVAGVKMKYPSNFVFLVGDEAYSSHNVTLSASDKTLHQSTNTCSSAAKESSTASLDTYDSEHVRIPHISPRQPPLPTLSYCIRNHVSQEMHHSNGLNEVGENCEDITAAFSNWEISDLSCRAGCICFRCKSSKSKGSKSDLTKLSNSPPKKEKLNEKENKYNGTIGNKLGKQVHNGHGLPFHRRYQSSESVDCLKLGPDIFDCPPRMDNGIKKKSSSSQVTAYATNQPTGNESPKSLLNGDSALPSSVSVSAIDSERPSESPAITFSVGSAIGTPATNGKDSAKPNLDTDMFSPMSAGRHSIGSPSVQWTPTATLEGLDGENNEKSEQAADPIVKEEKTQKPTSEPNSVQNHVVPTQPEVAKSTATTTGGIKRPLLPSESSLFEDCQITSAKENKSLLYDFTYVTEIHDWEQPRPKNRRMVRGLYTNDDRLNDLSMLSAQKTNSNLSSGEQHEMTELEDEFGNKRRQANVSTDVKQAMLNGDLDSQAVCSPKVLTRESDLAVSYRDLDQIFDSSSGDESNDDRTGSRTKNSTEGRKEGQTTDDTSTKSNVKNSASAILNVAELTRMFPTPPSLEPNAAPSPYSNTLTVGECTPGSDEHLHHFRGDSIYGASMQMVSPEPSKDTHFSVYSAPLQTKFISSSKYAPLANIPSMSPTRLPSQCNYKPSNVSSSNLIVKPPFSSSKTNLTNGIKQESVRSSSSANAKPRTSLILSTEKIGQSGLNKLDINRKANTNSSKGSSLVYGDTPQMLPEINSLLVNLVLSDSLLNVFKDHNFDSCPLCVCNMNIKGFDIDVYLPDTLLRNDEPQYKCSCGFSAINNRHLSCFAGLFFEDEQEVSGVCYDPTERLAKQSLQPTDKNSETDVEKVDPQMLELLKAQCASVFSSSSSLFKSFQYEWFNANQAEASKRLQSTESGDKSDEHEPEVGRLPVLLNNFDKIVSKRAFINGFNALLRSDSCEIAFLALMLGRAWLECWPSKSTIAGYNRLQQVRNRKEECVHEWLFMYGELPGNSGNEVRCLRRLHRLLSEGSLGKCIASATPRDMGSSSSSGTTSSGVAPLTWKQFYKLSGRNEDQSEPQPIPSLLVAHERDWVALSPFALKYWEKLALEPYSFSRDIAYIVVCPDSSHLINNVKSFFKDLSATYQMLRLGRHRPIARLLIDGVMRVGKATKKLADEPVDDWFSCLGNTSLAAKLKMYAQACRHYVAPHLKSLPLDRTLILEGKEAPASTTSATPSASSNYNPNMMMNSNSSVKSPASADMMNGDARADDLSEAGTPGGSGSSSSNGPNGNNGSQQESNESDDEQRQPHIVIYMVEPFTFTGLDEHTYRLACHGLMRCHLQLLQSLPESLQQHVHLQLISLDAVVSTGRDSSDCTRHEQLRSLAFSVFRQCRRVYAQQPLSKSLTGFGPSASLDAFLRSKDLTEVSPPARLYLPPFVLAPLKDKQTELGEMFGDRREQSQVLFASYCLTEDQRFLIVTCSNERGELSDNTVINVSIPNRHKRTQARILQFALHKMMQFLIGVMSQATQPWRLVLGRLGRVGHGELRAWASLLGRRQLQAYSKQLRDRCRQCALLNTLDTPCILSACLTSLEPDSRLRVFADQFSAGSNPAHTCTLNTPEDASCTHVLVFPTSSTTQSSQGGFQMDPLGTSIAEDDILQALGADASDDLAVDDIFEWGSPGSPGREHSATQLDSPTGRAGPFDGLGANLKVICLFAST